ncbi:heparan-alpha-glucosaminide N-acetyltransferase domain-containing protein [Asticcacaulis biprosthecium]|nr:DUF5009 domain-containing protein [Asticcacaulis biprosthecium]
MPNKNQFSRVGAIDLVRALTMVLMIFVNDLWSLKGVPVWLEHVASGVDGMGLSDVVFPAFLFIVGLSLPFAVSSRQARGDSLGSTVLHILGRSVALLVMGVFLVNGETIHEATGIPRLIWNVLSCVCFILIWNAYPKTMNIWLQRGLKALGAAVLLVMAVTYRGGDGTETFAPQWWGILGLIGWAYLAAGLVTALAQGRLIVLALAWLAFAGLSLAWAAGLVPALLHIIPEPIIGGTLTALVLGGAVIGRMFQLWQPPENEKKNDNLRMTLAFAAIAAALVALGFFTRQFWGISKLSATPAWLFLCSAITLAAFVALYWIGDVARQGKWFGFVKPAGTDTLLCYLMPYLVYAAMAYSALTLPDVLVTGGVGLIKSLLLALICVWLAGGLSRLGIKLKL